MCQEGQKWHATGNVCARLWNQLGVLLGRHSEATHILTSCSSHTHMRCTGTSIHSQVQVQVPTLYAFHSDQAGASQEQGMQVERGSTCSTGLLCGSEGHGLPHEVLPAPTLHAA